MWTVLQLGWIWGQDESLYKDFAPSMEQRLYPAPFQWGLQAYVVSRRGMEAMIDEFFSDRTPQGKMQLLDDVGVVEYYFGKLDNVLVALPSLFTVEGMTSTIEPSNSLRNDQHRESNSHHIHATLQLYYSSIES